MWKVPQTSSCVACCTGVQQCPLGLDKQVWTSPVVPTAQYNHLILNQSPHPSSLVTPHNKSLVNRILLEAECPALNSDDINYTVY